MSESPPAPEQTCATCGTALQGDEPSGLCPKCLLLTGMAEGFSSHLQIRCPQCQIGIEVVDDPSVREVTCPSCDSRFSLIGGLDATTVAETCGKVGRFELIEKIGIGAFGSVWKARDPEIDRHVAIKLPRKEQVSEGEAEQFLREAQAAGRLKHSGIVTVHEVGRDEDRIYIVSDLVQGVTLADSLSARRPSLTEAADICRRVAHALQHAHQQGVIHRDLKPSNIMLDDEGQPHVMDFGLAKREAAEVTMTVEGRILGTPAYMSPEQARGDAHRADSRSDIYSLGVILFEMLTGEKPFRGTSQMLLHQVLKEDPPIPRNLNSSVPRELETICLKCLEKEPEQRFASAQELADELQRFQNGLPIHSRPISSLERGSRWCRRNPVVAGLSTAVAASLLIGLITTLWQWRVAQQNFADANDARGIAEQSQRQTQTALDESESRLARVYVERGLRNIDVDPHSGLPWLIKALKTEPEDSPARKTHRLRLGIMLRGLPKLAGFWADAVYAEFSQDGSKVAIAVGNEALVYQLPEMHPIPVMRHQHALVSVTFTPKADRLATVVRTMDGIPLCRLWDAESGQPLTEVLDLTDREFNMREIPTIHFTPDGNKFTAVYAGIYNRWHSKMVTRVFDSKSMEQVGKTFAHHSDLDYTAGYHELSSDALRVVVPRGAPASDERIPWDEDDFPDDIEFPQQYDLITARPVHPPLKQELDFYGSPKYSPDGRLIATSHNGIIKVWSASDGSLVREFELDDRAHAGFRFHPEGKSLFVFQEDVAQWLEIDSGKVKQSWTYEDKFVIDPMARHAVYGDSNGENYVAQIHPEGANEDGAEILIPDFYGVHFSPDGSRFLLKPEGHSEAGEYVSPPNQIIDSRTGFAVTPPWRFDGRGIGEPFSRTGRFLLTRFRGEGVWLWDLDQRRRLVEPFPGRDRFEEQEIEGIAITRDHSRFVTFSKSHRIDCWNAETGERLFEPIQLVSFPSELEDAGREMTAMSGDGEIVAVTEFYLHPTAAERKWEIHVVRLWNLRTGLEMFDGIEFGRESNSGLGGLYFINNDRHLVVEEHVALAADSEAGEDVDHVTRLHVIDLRTGRPTRKPHEFIGNFRIMDVGADGRALVRRESYLPNAQPKFPEHLQVYDTQTWTPTTSRLMPRGGHPSEAILSPDGSRLVMGHGELWDTVNGERIVKALIPQRQVSQVRFQDDSQAFIAIADNDRAKSADLRRFSRDGESLGTPMFSSRTDLNHCAIHAETGLVAAGRSKLRFWDLQSGMPLSGAVELKTERSSGYYVSHRETFFSPQGSHFYICVDHHLRVIRLGDLVKSIPTDDELAAWACVLSGQRVDDAGGTVPLSGDELKNAWNRIRDAGKGGPPSGNQTAMGF